MTQPHPNEIASLNRDKINETILKNIRATAENMKRRHDQRAFVETFVVGDMVLIRETQGRKKLKEGKKLFNFKAQIAKVKRNQTFRVI